MYVSAPMAFKACIDADTVEAVFGVQPHCGSWRCSARRSCCRCALQACHEHRRRHSAFGLLRAYAMAWHSDIWCKGHASVHHTQLLVREHMMF